MTRRKKIGDIYRFDFDEKHHCYCQLLLADDFVFFDYYSSSQNDDIELVLKQKEIFRIWLDGSCLKSDRWTFICNRNLAEDKKNILDKFNKPVGSEEYQILRNDRFIPAEKKECIALEKAAAWTDLGITERLKYSFFYIEPGDYIKQAMPFYED